jgi:hypothetical protein
VTPAEIIQQTRVPDTNSVFFLGCFENRVTLYSQQVRALNLVDAILDQGLLRNHGKVAIVGGGAAGITAAAGLAKAAPALLKIDLFEGRDDILEYQHGSRRYLHPHIYDWPAERTDEVDAGLPILNWRAELAGGVADWLRKQFDETARGSPIKLHTRAKVTGVAPFDLAQARVLLTDANHLSDTYDVVILCIGFGLEAFLTGDTPSYWSPSALDAPILVGGVIPTIFVSGNGDGGLVDFMTAALNGLSHSEISDLIAGLPFGVAMAELLAIEQEAWRPGAAVDLFHAYRTRVLPLLPPAVLADIGDALRSGVSLCLHTSEPQLFKRTSALLNRIGVFLIIEADRNFTRGAIVTKVGMGFAGDVPTTGPVLLAGEAAFTPWRRFLRLGPDSRANLAPFQRLIDRIPAAARRPDPTFRPATPSLTDSAQRRFAAFIAPPEPPPLAAAAAVGGPTLGGGLRIDRGHARQLLVSGTLAVAALPDVWQRRQSLTIDCRLPVQDVERLVPALARLSGHAPLCDFYCTDRRRWEEMLHTLATGRAMPGPDLDVSFRVEDARDLPPTVGAIAISPDQLSDAIHTGLDKAIFDELHGALFDCLGRASPTEMGWMIEPALRAQLWDLWRAWHTIIEPDPLTRRRFLLLLVTERDSEAPESAALVRVGPKTLRPFLVKAALFGLAFAIGARRNLTPSPHHPGNLQTLGLTGHACGVSWIEGRGLNPANVDRPWTTAIVLLAELRSAFRLLQGEPRLDRDEHAPALIGDPAVAERPLILGADDVFQAALEAGEHALATYLGEVLAWRAAAADNSLERA